MDYCHLTLNYKRFDELDVFYSNTHKRTTTQAGFL